MSIPIQLSLNSSKDLEALISPDIAASISYKRNLYPDEKLFSMLLPLLDPLEQENPPSLWITVTPLDPLASPPIDMIEDQNGFLLMPVRKSSSLTNSNVKKPRTTQTKPTGNSKPLTPSVIVSPQTSAPQEELSPATLKLLSSAPTTTALTGGSPNQTLSDSRSSEESPSTTLLNQTQLLEKSSSQNNTLKRTDSQSRNFVNTADKIHLEETSTLNPSSQE